MTKNALRETCLALAGLGLSADRALVLLLAEGSPCIGKVADELNCTPQALTQILTRMENEGIVERVHDLEDRRKVRVVLKQRGKDIITSLTK